MEKEILAIFRYPMTIIRDNDSKTRRAPVRAYAEKGNIECKYVAASNPRGNVKVERMMRILERDLEDSVINEPGVGNLNRLGTGRL